LNIKRADFYPRASQHIEEIIGLVQRLIDKGFAYEKGGDVYFRVRRFSEYGRLSGKSIDELIAGARIEPTEHKEDPLDFALWKAAKPDEPYWFSPWSKGRPGWHIECSAMSMHYLGETFDIHMGGEDLIFPHHENEIAQSVAATGKEFARFWIHNGWVTLGGEKMAKSTGHYFLIEDLLKEYNPNVIRLYLLKTQYRNQLEFSEERLKEAKAAYLRIQTYIQGFNDLPDIDTPLMFEEFSKAMDDDLNTPKALGVIYDLITRGYEEGGHDIGASVRLYLDILGFNREKIEEPFAEVMQLFREVCARIEKENQRELLEQIKDDFWGGLDKFQGPDFVFPMVVNLLLKIRNIFRKEKKYEFADYIRKRLAEHHIQIQDKGMEITTYRLEAK
ncbi:MAG TPA: cysteine--tRNA ligase, partial [candidate division WOR-3 bacterium]|nr:cysteine--tRNA ligase [candidate division WOR-3 bacterium]